MRCYCCNAQLSNQEATRRFTEREEFVDMCNKCLNTIDEDVDVTDGYVDDSGDDDLWDERDE